MKTFLKMLLATLVGGLLLLFIVFVLVASLASLGEQKPEIAEHSILKIDLNTQFNDRAQDNPFEAFDPIGMQPQSAVGLNRFIATLHKAADDEKIDGIYLEGGIPQAGSATLREMRQALAQFADSGKFVYSYSEVFSQAGLYLCSAADTVWVHPEGAAEWRGLSASVSYYKDGLDKLGVKPVVLRATGNKFKSAVEPFLTNEMSVANHQQLSELLNSVWGTTLEEMGTARSLSNSGLNALADSLIINAQEAIAAGLVDGGAYEDEFMQLLRSKVGLDSNERIPFTSFSEYSDGATFAGNGGYKDAKIAVIYAQGEIGMGEGSINAIGSETTAKALRKARLDDDVKAIVLRINSPGGSALASDIIWREVNLAQQEKPVLASMGNVAASGGYYIACFADTIVAQPNTITGSIGAFGLFFTAQELMNDKLGINIETVKTNVYADLGTLDRDISVAEKKQLIHEIDQVYQTFTDRVAEGRHMSTALVDSLGQGRVYSGEDALELGLVDVLGGLQTTVDLAANKAGLEKYRLVEYPKLQDPIEKFIEELGGSLSLKASHWLSLPGMQEYQSLQEVMAKQGIQTRLPYDLKIQ